MRGQADQEGTWEANLAILLVSFFEVFATFQILTRRHSPPTSRAASMVGMSVEREVRMRERARERQIKWDMQAKKAEASRGGRADP